jgi:hypothetical protein
MTSPPYPGAHSTIPLDPHGGVQEWFPTLPVYLRCRTPWQQLVGCSTTYALLPPSDYQSTHLRWDFLPSATQDIRDYLGEDFSSLTWYCYQLNCMVLRCEGVEWENWILIAYRENAYAPLLSPKSAETNSIYLC